MKQKTFLPQLSHLSIALSLLTESNIQFPSSQISQILRKEVIPPSLLCCRFHTFSSSLNPNQGGIFGRSIGWGGVESAHGSFRAISSSFSHPNQPNMISNESWHLYLPLESLNSILSCIVLPQGGTEVA